MRRLSNWDRLKEKREVKQKITFNPEGINRILHLLVLDLYTAEMLLNSKPPPSML